jgi:TonB family protein
MTQDYEQTAAIEAARKKREEERQRALEAERQKQAELERQRIEAEARKKQEDEKRKIAEIDSRTKDAFGKSNSGTGATGSGTGQSQGVTYPGGNQGVPTGDPRAGTYGPGGSGSGTRGTGISYSLGNRTATSTPKPNYPGREEGVVVVKITVDQNGNVTQAEPGQKGTTTLNPELHDAARRAALQAKFNVDHDAPAFQIGSITYRFIIQSQ